MKKWEMTLASFLQTLAYQMNGCHHRILRFRVVFQ